MNPHRLSLKLFFDSADAVEPDPFIPLFHHWIQTGAVADHLLLDVADYRHVPQSQAVILIAHEADIAIDFGDDQPGLLYTRKRTGDEPFTDLLANLFAVSLDLARQIEGEESLNTPLRFDLSRLRLTLLDRLHYPNHDETFRQAAPHVEELLRRLHPDSTFSLLHANQDPRRPLSLDAAIDVPADLNEQLARLERSYA